MKRILNAPPSFISFRHMFFLVAIALLAWVTVTPANAAEEALQTGERLITVYDRGTERVFLTEADTVRDALDRADIELSASDTVEPKLDEHLIASDYNINIYRARPVVVVDGYVRQKVMTAHQTPTQIAESAGVELYPEDIATLTKADDILNDGVGLELTVDRATSVKLVLYGVPMDIRTQASTVSELIKEKGIDLSPQDELSVDRATSITTGMTIEIWRDGKQTVTTEEDVPYETERIQDADREIGFREIKTPGVNGRRTVTYEIEMKNGQEIGRKEIQSVIIDEPQKQIEIVGIKNKFSGSLNEWLLALRTCETGNNYSRNSGNGYYGAYQFLPSTWDRTAAAIGRHDLVGVMPHLALPADQDAMVIANTNRSGSGLASQHPGCYKKLGLSQFPPS